MVREILKATDPRLRKKSKPVKKFDKKTVRLIKDLKDTLNVQEDPEGVGLAAPQIGKNVRVFITMPKNKIAVFVNPKILSVKEIKKTKKSKSSKLEWGAGRKEKGKTMEGCLSLPHYYGPLKRAREIKIKYLNEEGADKVKIFKNLDAQIILHEIDHLNGILFVDRLLEQKKLLYELVGDEWQEVDLLL